MMRCKSCGDPMRPTTFTTEDGIVVEETFCGNCLNTYVWGVDELDTKEYRYAYLFEPKRKHLRNTVNIDEE